MVKESVKETAWQVLVVYTRALDGQELVLERLHQKFKVYLLNEESAFFANGWDFCADLVDDALMLRKRHIDGVTENLGEELRNEIAFDVLEGLVWERGLVLGAASSHEIAEYAAKAVVSQREVGVLYRALVRSFVRRLKLPKK